MDQWCTLQGHRELHISMWALLRWNISNHMEEDANRKPPGSSPPSLNVWWPLPARLALWDHVSLHDGFAIEHS